MGKGEVWWVRIPFTGGHEQAGERPALIVQGDAATATLPTVLIIPFTSVMGTSRFTGTMVIQPNPQNGLTSPSVALVFQIRALDKRCFLRRMGELDQGTLDQLFELLDRLMER
jgi:mRNA interferase MazF